MLAEQLAALRLAKAIDIQRYTRGWFARCAGAATVWDEQAQKLRAKIASMQAPKPSDVQAAKLVPCNESQLASLITRNGLIGVAEL